jgi:hypothetical protein
VSINKVVDDLLSIEKEHLFTVLEEKLDYPANLDEFVRKKAVKATILEIGTKQQQFKDHLRKKCERRGDSLCEACVFAATRLGHVCVGNQFSFISAIESGDKTKESIA